MRGETIYTNQFRRWTLTENF